MNNVNFPTKKNDSQPSFEIEIPKEAENLQLPNSTLLQFYKALERREFWMIGPVDSTLYDLVQYIVDWNYEDRGINPEYRTPIKIFIASNGGSLEVEKTLSAVIKMSKTPIIGIAIGICASAASMIYLSCHKRLATKNVTFVFHQGSCSNLEGTYQEISSFMENYRKDIEEMSAFYKANTNYSPELIDANLNSGDWYIDSEEALKNGVVHSIIDDIDVLWN